MSSQMSSHPYPVIESRLTTVRMAPYLSAVGGDHENALGLYLWNLKVSAAFYVDLSTAEVVLRNAIDSALQAKFGSGQSWFDNVNLSNSSGAHLSAAIDRAAAAGHNAHNDIVAQLSFGFWRSLFTKYYRATLWPVIRPVFLADPDRQAPRAEGTFQIVDELGYLRNRIAHHETIFRRDLPRQFQSLLSLTGSICLDTRRWVEDSSGVSDLLAVKPTIH
jgi:hypothetical protein